jgi:phospholipid-translocating ATPase
MLRKAGIKVWMLTGDKMETAYCISISTGLLAPIDKVWQIERITRGSDLKQMMKGFKDTAIPEQVDHC